MVECYSPVFVRGLCRPHYNKWYQGSLRGRDVGYAPAANTNDRTLLTRIFDYTEKNSGVYFLNTECWRWTNRLNGHGYGVLTYKGKTQLAHRAVWEAIKGPVPSGLECDHLCRNRWCVNPEHIELISHRENVLRGNSVVAANAKKTQCKNGHEFSPENTAKDVRGGRVCKTCRHLYYKANYQPRRSSL